jgi:hypothetical protein
VIEWSMFLAGILGVILFTWRWVRSSIPRDGDGHAWFARRVALNRQIAGLAPFRWPFHNSGNEA